MDDDDHVDLINQLKLKYPPIVVEEAPEPSLNYDVHGPRLIIHKIENENFKSYGGKCTLGPFHKNFTCVIGPNGSGKSNVIDSLLFVFGFRAAKIRSKKLNVLIHKSELYPNVDSCSVRVYFQKIKPFGEGDADYEVIPKSEFVVVRTAFKDNTSIYKINDRRVNNKEVADFLKKQGIDLDHNRFLILQGEVEQIALMKPKAATEYEDGFLEYLEDIIGSHRFKEPLKILFSRLEELCDLRTEKLNRVKVVGKEKKELEGVRNEAVKYLRLCNEIVIRKNISFQLKMRDLKLLEATAVEKQNEVKLELEQIECDIERINELRRAKEKELKETVQAHLMKIQQFDVSHKRFRDLEIEDANLRDKRKGFKVKLDELAKMIKAKEKDIAKYEKVPSESESRIEELKNEEKILEESKLVELNNQERIQISLKKEVKGLDIEKDLKSAELREQQELITKQEAEIVQTKCDLELLVGTYEKEKAAYDQLESNLESIKDRITDSKEQLSKLSVNIPKITEEYNDITNKLSKLKEDEKILSGEVDQLFHKLNTGRSIENESKVIGFLFSQQKAGRVSGVIGRLGNLAAIDVKYDVAVSTACNRLDNIVTENINNAQRCVELMKANNINRATFIGVDKMKSWESKATRPFKLVHNVPRAFDLLNIPNKKFRAVFYFALRDLLISNDTRESVQINRGRDKFRIVTMKGQITEIHGAMTGGGNRMIQGKICIDPAKIQEYGHSSNADQNIDHRGLEQKIREKEQRLNEVRQEINHLVSRSEVLKVELMKSNDSQSNLTSNLTFLYQKENVTRKELDHAQEKLKTKRPDVKRVKEIETVIENLTRKYNTDCASAKIVSDEVEQMNKKITSIGVARLEPIKMRLASIGDKIKENARMLKKINVSVKNAEAILVSTVADIENLKGDKIKYHDQVEEMDVTLKNMEKKAEDTLQEYNTRNEEMNELMAKKDEQSKAVGRINDELQQSRQVKIQIQRDFEEKKQKVDQIRGRVRQMQDEIQKLKLYPMPEGVQEDDDDNSFMELVGETGDPKDVYSSQKDSHTGTKLKVYSDEELLALRVHQITYQDLEDKLQQQRPNLAAIEEYRQKEELYMQRAAELNEVTQLRDFQREQLERLKRQRHQEFTAGFNLITSKLKEMYQMITMGGDAELELVDSLDPFSEGILFSVRPPNKSWKNISNLSGGEKTLSSLALVFALHHFKPTPFYVMDEIDAALDFKNVSIVANYLKARTKNAQFIIISLRNNMYELSDRLVGILKPYNVSNVTVIKPSNLAMYLKSSKIIPIHSLQSIPSQPIQSSSQNQPMDLAETDATYN